MGGGRGVEWRGWVLGVGVYAPSPSPCSNRQKRNYIGEVFNGVEVVGMGWWG